MTRIRFDVPEISCETCKTVTVSYEPRAVDAARLVEVIEEQGYDVQRFTEVS